MAWGIKRKDGASTSASITNDGNATFPENKGTSSIYYVISYSGEGGCTCELEVEQKPSTCNCTDNSITPHTLSWSSTELDNKLAFEYPSCCTPTVTLSDTTNFSYDTSTSGKVYVKPNSENTTLSARDVNISLSIVCDGTTCNGSTSGSQNGTQCTPSECTCYLVSEATCEKVAATATTATVKWQYSAITWNTLANCTVTSSMTKGEENKEVTFAAATCNDYSKTNKFNWNNHRGCNLSTSSCTDTDVEVTWKVEQERPADCDCTCDDVKVSTASTAVTVDKSVIVGYTADCLSESAITSSTEEVASVSVANGIITIQGKKEGSATITLSGNVKGEPCAKTIDVTVNCPTITISPNNSSGDCSGGTVTFKAS